MFTLAPPVDWASIHVYLLMIQHHIHIFHFNSFTQLVHSDVWTSPFLSHFGYKYYVVFLDDYTHYLWIVPLRNKSDMFQTIRAFISYVHTQFHLPILAF